MERVIEILVKENIEHIVSSLYVRARQTVEGLSKNIHKAIELDTRFRERDLAALKYPGGESNSEVQECGINGLRDVVSNIREKEWP
ncbi:histidine phosphatase family protein [Neobacillus drentensis]|uniref:histidine phosphatase family protein n=1 Tax=Neobacillus drentensis TaxID=220684 RepID=UPI002FFE6292